MGLSIVAALTVLLAYSSFIESTHPCIGDECYVVKKPAVYLYPLEDTTVSVRVATPGKIVKSEPLYGGGWRVSVTPEGLIDGKYPYLFYEAALPEIEKPSRGWIVPYEDLGPWFDEKLPELGLSSSESKDFKDYWLTSLPESRYYRIGLFSDGYLERNMDLVVDPRPDTEIRLLFYFKPLQESATLEEPEVSTPKRTGFTLVEWGGVLDA